MRRTFCSVVSFGVIAALIVSNQWLGGVVGQDSVPKKQLEKCTMKFGYTLLFVTDVEKTISFYESAFGQKRKFIAVDDAGGYGELDTGPTTLGFVSHKLAKASGTIYTRPDAKGPAPAVEIAFVTDDVDASFKKAVKAGAVAVASPKKKPWGQTVSYVRDLNGFLVEICSPISE